MTNSHAPADHPPGGVPSYASEQIAPFLPADGGGWTALELRGDPTNWWVPNHAAVAALLRTAGLRVSERPGHEIYLCVPDRARNGHASLDPDEVETAASAALRHEGNGQTCEGTPPHE